MSDNKLPTKAKIQMRTYEEYWPPYGFLVANEKACSALWHYYVTAYATHENQTTRKYEGDQSEYNFGNLYRTIAILYGADPDKMQNFWPAVNLQAMALGLPLLPNHRRSPDRMREIFRGEGENINVKH